MEVGRARRVRVQWDPERSPSLGPLPYRSLQVGLSGQVVDRYVDEWIVGISDVTDQAHAIRNRLATGDRSVPPGLLPAERPYQLPAAIGATIGVAATQPGAASEAAVQLAESKVLSGHVRLE